MTNNQPSFAEAMKQLEEINRWFQEEDIDLDEGLKKLRDGKALLQQCRERLKEVENEFVKIKEEFVVAEKEEIPTPAIKTSASLTDDDLPF